MYCLNLRSFFFSLAGVFRVGAIGSPPLEAGTITAAAFPLFLASTSAWSSSAVFTSRTSSMVPSAQFSSSRHASTSSPLTSGVSRTSCARTSSRTSPSIVGSSSTAIATIVAAQGFASSSAQGFVSSAEARLASTPLCARLLGRSGSALSNMCIKSMRWRTRSSGLSSHPPAAIAGCKFSSPPMGTCDHDGAREASPRGKQPSATIARNTSWTRAMSSLCSFGWSASSWTASSESCSARIAMSTSPSRAHNRAASNRCSGFEASAFRSVSSRPSAPPTHALSELSRPSTSFFARSAASLTCL